MKIYVPLYALPHPPSILIGERLLLRYENSLCKSFPCVYPAPVFVN